MPLCAPGICRMPGPLEQRAEAGAGRTGRQIGGNEIRHAFLLQLFFLRPCQPTSKPATMITALPIQV